jgi:hypothetical protein
LILALSAVVAFGVAFALTEAMPSFDETGVALTAVCADSVLAWIDALAGASEGLTV